MPFIKNIELTIYECERLSFFSALQALDTVNRQVKVVKAQKFSTKGVLATEMINVLLEVSSCDIMSEKDTNSLMYRLGTRTQKVIFKHE